MFVYVLIKKTYFFTIVSSVLEKTRSRLLFGVAELHRISCLKL